MYDILEVFFVKQTKLCDNRFIFGTFDEIEFHDRITTHDRHHIKNCRMSLN